VSCPLNDVLSWETHQVDALVFQVTDALADSVFVARTPK
jgi:hypothetical protein